MGRHQVGKTAGTHGAITQIRDWHRAVIRLSVLGKRPEEIALVVDLTEQQISRILGSPLVIKEIERLQSLADYEAVNMAVELRMRQGKALEAIDQGLSSDDERLAVSTGFEILDRTGYGKKAEPQRHLHLHEHRQAKDMTDEDLLDDVINLAKGDNGTYG